MAQEDIRGKDLPNIATAFADDDIIIVDGDNNGTRRMPKDTLLSLTAQNALAGNMAQAFDPTRDEEHAYKAGESVVYEGETYTFKVDHYGDWVAADAESISVFGEIDKLNSANRLGLTYSVSNSKYHSQTIFYSLKAGDVVSVYVGNSTEEGYSGATVYYYTDSAHSLGNVQKGKYATFTIPADCVRVTIQFNYAANTTSSHTIFFGLLTAGSAAYDLDDYIKSKDYKDVGTVDVADCLLSQNGSVISTNVWDVSSFVELPFNTGSKFYVKSSVYGNGAICFYDENKSLVYSFDGNGASGEGYTQDIAPVERVFTMGSTWKYVRYCVCKQNSVTMADCYVISSSCGWGDVGEYIIKDWKSFKKSESDYLASKEYKKIGVLGVAEALLLTNGNTVSTNLWDVSSFVELPFNTGSKFYVKSSVYGNGAICFYDEDYNIVYSFNGSEAEDEGYTQDVDPIEREFTMGATWKYVRYCVCKLNPFGITDCYVSSHSCGWKEMGQRFIDELTAIQDKVKFVKTLAEKKVLIIGDSISTYDYGTYKKWNDVLKDQGFFGEDYVNSSQHATGFVANRVGGTTCRARLKAIQNPETFDYVIIFCGINDFIQSIPWGTAGGDADTEFIPAVDDFFDYLVKNFLNARIVILSPLRTHNKYPNQAGKTQDEYAAAIRAKAEYYSLPVLNLTEHSGFCPYITEFKDAWTLVPQGYNVHDGVHPIYEYGRDFLAPMIAKFLQEYV